MNKRIAKLNWQVATEQDNYGFDVVREEKVISSQDSGTKK